MKIHELKTEPPYFQAVLDGRKRFEIRKNDRGFEEGDKLLLKEYQLGVMYTGRRVEVTVTYITDYEQQPGYVVLGIELTMTEQELKEIRERLEAATPGKWFQLHFDDVPIGVVNTWDDSKSEIEDKEVCRCKSETDAEFIAHAIEDIRRLLKDNARQKGALQQIEKWLAGTLANEDLTIVESKILEIARKALKV